MRPRADLSLRLAEVFESRAPCSWRAVLPEAQIDVRSPAEVRLVCHTVKNMARRGDLVSVGREKEAGSRVYRSLYEPAAWHAGCGTEQQALAELDQVTRTWATFD